MKRYVKINEGGTIVFKNKPIRIPREIGITSDLDLQELEAALRMQGVTDYKVITETKVKVDRITPQPKQKIVSTIPMRPSTVDKINLKG